MEVQVLHQQFQSLDPKVLGLYWVESDLHQEEGAGDRLWELEQRLQEGLVQRLRV